MEIIPLSIPYLVLSTQQHIDGRRQIHTRTPFGSVDISVKRLEGVNNPPLFDVTVEGDLETWVLDQQMPAAFKNALFKMVGKMAVTHSGWSIHKQCRLAVNFKGAAKTVTMTGDLEPSDFIWQTEAFASDFHHHCA
ncbi:MAG: hypothetical protein RBT11_00910 [Desulfobacterales bacterium]|jgi:hypothetical protein|nr:hypothetical protein [Desulfobacterales bacterium]